MIAPPGRSRRNSSEPFRQPGGRCEYSDQVSSNWGSEPTAWLSSSLIPSIAADCVQNRFTIPSVAFVPPSWNPANLWQSFSEAWQSRACMQAVRRW